VKTTGYSIQTQNIKFYFFVLKKKKTRFPTRTFQNYSLLNSVNFYIFYVEVTPLRKLINSSAVLWQPDVYLSSDELRNSYSIKMKISSMVNAVSAYVVCQINNCFWSSSIHDFKVQSVSNFFFFFNTCLKIQKIIWKLHTTEYSSIFTGFMNVSNYNDDY